MYFMVCIIKKIKLNTYQLIPHIITSNVENSGISKFCGINISHPKRASIASNSPCSLSLTQHVLRSRNSIDAIGPFLLFPKFNTQFCGSSSTLFNPNLGTRSSLIKNYIYNIYIFRFIILYIFSILSN